MKIAAPLLLLCLLAACGGADPTPEAENSASAAAINASVAQAENKAEDAERAKEGIEAAEARGRALARETLARDAAATGESSNETIPPLPAD